MAKQVRVRYVYNAGFSECRDCTVGCVYDAELPAFGEVDKDGVEVLSYDELWITKDDAGDAVVTRLSAGFELVEEQDDPLPPAPESVRYYHRGYHGIHADKYLDVRSGNFLSGPHIRINDKDNRGITIDADAALQLAHDLNRMANEIKRKEKQNA